MFTAISAASYFSDPAFCFSFPLSGGPDSKARDGRRARRKAPEGHATGRGM